MRMHGRSQSKLGCVWSGGSAFSVVFFSSPLWSSTPFEPVFLTLLFNWLESTSHIQLSSPRSTMATATKSVALSEDFIGFDWDEDEDAEFLVEEQQPASTAHAVGQPQLYTKGRKRTADEMERADDDGYSKKQRIAAESRVTPWAVGVDWDNCRNAADMYVPRPHVYINSSSSSSSSYRTEMSNNGFDLGSTRKSFRL